MAGTLPVAEIRLDLAAVTAFPGSPNLVWPWSPREASYVHVGSDTTIELSLDGSTVCASITPGTSQCGIVLHAPQPNVWARAAAGGGTSVLLLATAEGT